ncbi:MAG: glycosyltransferase family 4 protein [Patescibacteria group bacterium]
MRIVLATGIYPPDTGGPASYTQALSVWLKEQGHDVQVICYSGKEGDDVIRVLRAGNVLSRYWRYAKAVYHAAKKADIVYLQGPVSEGLPGTIGAMLAGKPTVMKIVGDYAWEQAQQQGEKALLDEFLTKTHKGGIRLMEVIERWTAKRAKRIITPSRYLKTVVERWGVATAKIEVILNAQEPLPAFSASLGSAPLSLREKGDEVVCFTAARAVPWKGVKELIEWWASMPETHHLVIAGTGPDAELWKELIDTSPAKERITYRGALTRAQMAEQYAMSDVFLLDSGYEGYPHVVAEAASLGVPCLVSDKGGNPETVEQFGDLVTVLPYLERDTWVQAITGMQKKSTIAPRATSWRFEDMAKATQQLLEQNA